MTTTEPNPLLTACAWCPPARRAAATDATPVSHTICPACAETFRRQRANLQADLAAIDADLDALPADVQIKIGGVRRESNLQPSRDGGAR